MENFYSLEDIKLFLCGHEVIMYDKDTDKNGSSYTNRIKANVLFVGKKEWEDVILKVDELNFQIFKEDCEICYQDTTFSTKLLKDLSKEWIAFLVQKYPESSSLMKRIIASKMKELHENTEDAIKPLQKKINKIKQDEQAEMDHLRNLDVLVGEVFNLIK